jgi:hypothetical protein
MSRSMRLYLEDILIWDIVETKITPLLELVQQILAAEFEDE